MYYYYVSEQDWYYLPKVYNFATYIAIEILNRCMYSIHDYIEHHLLHIAEWEYAKIPSSVIQFQSIEDGDLRRNCEEKLKYIIRGRLLSTIKIDQ